MNKLSMVTISAMAGAMLSMQAFGASLNYWNSTSTNDCTGRNPMLAFDVDDDGAVNGFDDCAVNADGTLVSPVIAKYNLPGDDDEGGWEVASWFPSIDGSEFDLDFENGTWAYTPGAGDPVIRFWTEKYGGGQTQYPVTLFWYTEGDACATGGAPTLACLQSAIGITGADIQELQGLSHLTFFDTEVPVPVPGTLGLLGLGMIGLGMVRRKKQA